MAKRSPLTCLLQLAAVVLLMPALVMLVEHPAAAVEAAPSGEAMPVGDLPGWKQIFTDDFTTDVPLGSFPKAVTTKWGVYVDGGKDTSKHGTYMPSKVVSIAGRCAEREHPHRERRPHGGGHRAEDPGQDPAVRPLRRALPFGLGAELQVDQPALAGQQRVAP